MKPNQQKLLMAGLVATLLFGCNFPGQAPSDESRVVVHFGNIQLAPNADLAIVLDVKALFATDYKVQQTAGSTNIQTISAKVTGSKLTQPIVTSVNLIDCTSGLATLNFSNLPPGPVDIAVNAIDFGGQPVAWATGSAVIKPNQTAQVTLKCSSVGGNLVVNFDCPDLCAGSPTPTPTPTPPPPANPPASLLSNASGITIDGSGNLYIFGTDPGYPTASTTSRFIQVDGRTHQVSSKVYDDALMFAVEGEIQGDSMSYTDPWTVRRYNLATDTVTVTKTYHQPQTGPGSWVPFNSNCLASDGKVVAGFSTLRSYGDNLYPYVGIYSESGTIFRYNSDFTMKNRINALAYAAADNKVVFATHAGIGAVPYTNLPNTSGDIGPSPEQNYLLDLRPSNEAAYGFALIGTSSTEFLFTKQGNQPSIFYWGGSTPKEVLRSQYGYPIRVEKGADGKFYVLVMESPVGFNGSGGAAGGYMSSRYRVVRFTYNQATQQLEAPVLMVDTMPEKAASFAYPNP